MSLLGEIRYIDERGDRYLYAPGDHVLVRRDLVVDDDGETDYESFDGKIHCSWYSEKECLARERGYELIIEACIGGWYRVENDPDDWMFIDTFFCGLVNDTRCEAEVNPILLNEILLL